MSASPATRVLTWIAPERAHRIAVAGLRVLGARRPLRQLVAAVLRPPTTVRVSAFGRQLSSPLGVAGGFDKNGECFAGLLSLGFGFVEVGSVTMRAQPGNPVPRIHRLPRERALINSMGSPNAGAQVVAARVANRRRIGLVGISAGLSETATAVDAEFASVVAAVAGAADYVVLNVSTPNTPGVTAVQVADRLAGVVAAARAELDRVPSSVPLLLKVSPDLTDSELDAFVDVALAFQLDGIVAVNTTTRRDGIPHDARDIRGGVSGEPLRQRSLVVLRQVAARTDGRLVLISVGGVSSSRDVWDRLVAGATLVQAYTAFVFGGPLWPWRINRALAQIVREAGAASLEEAVATERQAISALP